jgi:hypothetical protein
MPHPASYPLVTSSFRGGVKVTRAWSQALIFIKSQGQVCSDIPVLPHSYMMWCRDNNYQYIHTQFIDFFVSGSTGSAFEVHFLVMQHSWEMILHA